MTLISWTIATTSTCSKILKSLVHDFIHCSACIDRKRHLWDQGQRSLVLGNSNRSLLLQYEILEKLVFPNSRRSGYPQLNRQNSSDGCEWRFLIGVFNQTLSIHHSKNWRTFRAASSEIIEVKNLADRLITNYMTLGSVFSFSKICYLPSSFACRGMITKQLSRGEICVANFITPCEWWESG